LRENLRLQLLTARLALMHGEFAVMQENLDLAQKWLQEHFAGDAQVVQYAREEMDQMTAIKFPAQLPVLTDVLEALQNLSRRFSR
jgi:uroporphyrin-3 C-methyltransferase